MKLGLVADYKHILTSVSNNIDYTTIDMLKNPAHIKQEMNYISFNENYEPFKYPPAHVYNNRISRIKKLNTSSLSDQLCQKQLYVIQLRFAEKEFRGEGYSLQLAKHDAAAKAFEYFSIAENFLKAKELAAASQNKSSKAYRPPQFYKNIKPVAEEEDPSRAKPTGEESKSTVTVNVKSEIMLVHEYGNKLKKPVKFEVRAKIDFLLFSLSEYFILAFQVFV
jgi:hypothetical protein